MSRWGESPNRHIQEACCAALGSSVGKALSREHHNREMTTSVSGWVTLADNVYMLVTEHHPGWTKPKAWVY